MRIGCVIQRYGPDISGGAELHCRLIANHLSRQHHVEVFTTCAQDYVTWRNEFSSGTEMVQGIPVHRFPVKRGRIMRRFIDIQNLVFFEQQSSELEEKWIRENGPYCPRLVKAVGKRTDIDVWILFSYRYWTTVHALRAVHKRALLVPTAEHDPALYLQVFKDIFNLPQAVAYNSVEERELINTISGNTGVRGDVVGVGLVDQEWTDQGRPVEAIRDLEPYIIYVGRIDKNKGCDHMFRYFQRFCREERDDVRLVLIGTTVLPVPDHPQIKHLGYVSEQEKMSAIASAGALIMPSQFESLSMVLLEAWKVQRPAIVNGRCEVLDGQCRRANGGLPYASYEEFAEAVNLLVDHPEIGNTLGRQGHAYYEKHYRWPVIMDKYDKLMKTIAE